MEKEALESIITSIKAGDLGQALNIAESALGRLALHSDTVEDHTPDYFVGELFIEDAKNLVSQAIRFCKDFGKEAALAEISLRDGIFVDGEQYVFVLDESGVMLAHGINQSYVGRDFLWEKDFDGKTFEPVAELSRLPKACRLISDKFWQSSVFPRMERAKYIGSNAAKGV